MLQIRKFRESFIFVNSVKRHGCHVKNSRLRSDLPISVNDSEISPFIEDFIFTKLRICLVSRIQTLAKICKFTVPNTFERHSPNLSVSG